jgi:hypothetical protein
MRSKLAAAVAVLSVLAGPAGAATTALPKACPTVAERDAERLRHLQTELMVAALKCRNNPQANLTEPYNAFVRKYSDVLLVQSNVLQGYFKRQYGPGYLKKFDTYITQLANEVSRRSQTTPQYCQAVRPLLASVLQVEPARLASFDGKLPPTQAVVQSPKCKMPGDMKSAAKEPAKSTKTAASTASKPKPAAKAAPKPQPTAAIEAKPVASAN